MFSFQNRALGQFSNFWTKLKKTRRNNRSEEMENEEIQGTKHERLKAMFIKSSKRRNAICKVKMPREYFDAFPYLELLNTLSNSGLT